MSVCVQGARIEEQRSALPSVSLATVTSAPTVPDEDFITLIQRLQSNRLEEQRSSLAQLADHLPALSDDDIVEPSDVSRP